MVPRATHVRPTLVKVIIQAIPSEPYMARRGQNEIKGETEHRGLAQLEGGREGVQLGTRGGPLRRR